MTTLITTFITLLIAAAAISAYRIVRLAQPLWIRVSLLGLRFALFSLVAIAFFEPVFFFDKLPSPRHPVPVLIDDSKSMQLFAPDSALAPAFSAIGRWNAGHTDKGRRFVFFRFGDSLRFLDKPADLSWSDSRSFLPESMKSKTLRHAPAMLLVSDGNWSNATLPSTNFSGRAVYYLPLSRARYYPYLQMEPVQCPKESPLDSPVVATLGIEGVTDRERTLELSVFSKNRKLAKRSALLGPGPFKRDIQITFKNRVAGRHVYRFEAKIDADSLVCSRYTIHSVVPDRFRYAVYNSRPTLDRRFFQQSIKRRRDFTESPDAKKGELDLLAVFDWDEKTRDRLGLLKPGGVILFIGALPGNHQVEETAGEVSFVRSLSLASGSSLDAVNFASLPAPSSFITSKDAFAGARTVLLRAAIHKNQEAVHDTIDVLFTGRMQGRPFVACCARDIWRWDFWPLAIEPAEERIYGFSHAITELAKELLLNGLSDELQIYPAAALSEADSLFFRIALPAEVPASSDFRLTCSFSSAGNPASDSSFVISASGSLKGTIRLKPLPAGRYRFEATGAVNGRRYPFDDSIAILPDRSEYAIGGQNTSLLQEIAQPLADTSTAALAALFESNPELLLPVKESIRFNRTWPLLLLILLILGVEWIFRRVIRLD